MVYISYIMKIAKVFYSGRSQAVRIPKEFRFHDKELHICKEGEAVILEPLKKAGWPKGFWDKIHIRDQRFSRAPQGNVPSRPALDEE